MKEVNRIGQITYSTTSCKELDWTNPLGTWCAEIDSSTYRSEFVNNTCGFFILRVGSRHGLFTQSVLLTWLFISILQLQSLKQVDLNFTRWCVIITRWKFLTWRRFAGSRFAVSTQCRNQTRDIYVSLRLHVQNAVPAQPCVGKLGISLVLLNFLHCNFRLWFKTP